jgi:hypothetical protein
MMEFLEFENVKVIPLGPGAESKFAFSVIKIIY